MTALGSSPLSPLWQWGRQNSMASVPPGNDRPLPEPRVERVSRQVLLPRFRHQNLIFQLHREIPALGADQRLHTKDHPGLDRHVEGFIQPGGACRALISGKGKKANVRNGRSGRSSCFLGNAQARPAPA